MDSKALLWIYAIFLLFALDAVSASRGGGRRGGSRKQGSRGSSRMQIYIPRNQDGASYYDNANVSIMKPLFSSVFFTQESKRDFLMNIAFSQGARIIKSSHFEMDYVLGRKITFFCMAQGIPRPHITWFKDGVEPYAHKCFQV